MHNKGFIDMKQKITKLYLKYIVKSSKLFAVYVGIFIAVFLIMTMGLKLEIRTSYDAEMNGQEIKVLSEEKIKLTDKQVYVYIDRNQEVFPMEVSHTDYKNGAMYFYLNNNQNKIFGSATLEITTQKRSLFESIFTKAGVQQ